VSLACRRLAAALRSDFVWAAFARRDLAPSPLTPSVTSTTSPAAGGVGGGGRSAQRPPRAGVAPPPPPPPPRWGLAFGPCGEAAAADPEVGVDGGARDGSEVEAGAGGGGERQQRDAYRRRWARELYWSSGPEGGGGAGGRGRRGPCAAARVGGAVVSGLERVGPGGEWVAAACGAALSCFPLRALLGGEAAPFARGSGGGGGGGGALAAGGRISAMDAGWAGGCEGGALCAGLSSGLVRV
jgi:hypothetical protein